LSAEVEAMAWMASPVGTKPGDPDAISVAEMLQRLTDTDDLKQEQIPVKYTATKEGDPPTPFGDQPGISLFKDEHLEVFCVDCHFEGTVDIQGSLQFTTEDGITGVRVDFVADLDLLAQLGIVAQLQMHKELSVPIFSKAMSATLGLPFYDLGSALNVGIYLEEDVVAKFDLSLEGKALVGVRFKWRDFKSTVDTSMEKLADVEIIQPVVSYTHDFEGRIGVSADLSAKTTFGAGFELDLVPKKKGKLDLGMYLEPGLNLHARYDSKSSECRNGIEAGMSPFAALGAQW
jgi:hypothetical protein